MATPITSTQQTEILQLVVGIFGAAPGADYMNEFAAYITTSGASIGALSDALMNTSAATSSTLYPNYLTASAFATKFVDNLVGSTVTATQKADAASYIESQLNAGHTRGEMVWWAINALANVDAANADWGTAHTQLLNKVTVASYYTITQGLTSTDLGTLQSVVSSVTSTAASITAAEAAIDNGTIGGSNGGLTISLTSAADQPTMSIYNDTISSLLGNFQATDVVDGKGGTDIMTVRVGDVAAPGAPQITNVEVMNFIEMGSANVSFANMAGYTAVNVWGGGNSALLNNMSAVTIGVISGWGGDLSIGYASETATNDTITLSVNQASAFNLLESDNDIEAFSIVAAGSGVDITLDGGSAMSSISITGTANVIIAVDRDSAVSGLNVNATALQGNLTLTLGSQIASSLLSANELNFKSGTGDDIFFITGSAAGRMASALALDGGAGTDTLRLNVNSQQTLLPGSTAIETLQLVTLAGGDCASVSLSAAANHFSTFSLWGAAGSAAIQHLSANPTINVMSGNTGELALSLETAAGTADAITVNLINGASGFRLLESAIGNNIETFTLNFSGTGYSGSTASLWGVGSADVTIGGSVNVKIGLSFSGFVGTGDVVINATALAGNLNLTYEGTAHDIRINAGTGSDTINLGTSLYGGVNAPTAIVDGGEGTDTLAFVAQSGQSAMPFGNSIEAATVTFMSGSEGGYANLGKMSGLTTVAVQFFSNSTANSVTNIAAAVTTVSVSLNSGVSAASATLNLNFVSGAAAAVTVRGNETAAAATLSNEFGVLDVNSAATLTLNLAGTGAQSSLGLYADESTALTINVTGSGRMSFDNLSALNATNVTFNSTAGGSLWLGCANLGTATLLTLNAAGSGQTGMVIQDLNLPAAATGSNADLTINANNSATVNINSATMGDDLTINAIGGDVNISALQIAHMSGADSAVTITLVAGGTGDVIAIKGLVVSAAANTAATLGFVISGSGNVTLNGAMDFSGVSNSAFTISVDASGLHGTLSFNTNSAEIVTDAASGNGLVITMGDDVSSANSAAGSSAIDTIQGGANHDYIVGAGGNDLLGGGGGADTIIGGAGQDTMSGGAGSDNFRFLSSAGAALLDGTGNISDIIVDFGSGDTITFSGVTSIGYSANGGATAVGSVSVLTASLTGLTLDPAANSAYAVAMFQDSGNTIIQVSFVTGVALSAGTGLVQITLQGITSFTSLTGLFSVSIHATNGLTITMV